MHQRNNHEHLEFLEFRLEWRRLRDAFEGTGGFADGTLLWSHPREFLDHDQPFPKKPSKKLRDRRANARYENYAAAIVEQIRSALFRAPVTRTIGGSESPAHPLRVWWQDVDGAGCGIDDFISAAWVGAAVFGHTVLYVDRTGLEDPQTAADTRPVVKAYTPLDLPDWLFTDGQLRAVKFLEPFERGSFEQPDTPLQQTRVVDDETWTLYGPNGERLGGGEHGFGRLPVVILYAHKRPLRQVIGQSVIGTSKLHVDLFNIISETRELERNQYGLLNVALGDRSVEDARAMMGQEVGTGNVMFTPGAAQFSHRSPRTSRRCSQNGTNWFGHSTGWPACRGRTTRATRKARSRAAKRRTPSTSGSRRLRTPASRRSTS